MTEDKDEPPELFRPRPGDEIVEPLFGALRGEVDMNKAPNERRHAVERVVHQVLRTFPP